MSRGWRGPIPEINYTIVKERFCEVIDSRAPG